MLFSYSIYLYFYGIFAFLSLEIGYYNVFKLIFLYRFWTEY